MGAIAPVTTPQLAGSVASSGTSGTPEVLGERGDAGTVDVVLAVAVDVDAVLDDVDLGELVTRPSGTSSAGERPVGSSIRPDASATGIRAMLSRSSGTRRPWWSAP